MGLFGKAQSSQLALLESVCVGSWDLHQKWRTGYWLKDNQVPFLKVNFLIY